MQTFIRTTLFRSPRASTLRSPSATATEIFNFDVSSPMKTLLFSPHGWSYHRYGFDRAAVKRQQIALVPQQDNRLACHPQSYPPVRGRVDDTRRNPFVGDHGRRIELAEPKTHAHDPTQSLIDIPSVSSPSFSALSA